MSKKRKTKREKIIADLRKKLSQTKDAAQRTSFVPNNELLRSRATEYPSESSFAASRLPRPGTGGQASHASRAAGIRTQNKHIPYVSSQKEKVQKDYSYVLSDMKRTGSIVSVIVLANLILALLLKKI